MTLTLEHLAKMQEGRARKSAEDRQELILEVLTRPSKHCECGITPESTDRELQAMGAGCTAPWFVCPVLDIIRRTL